MLLWFLKLLIAMLAAGLTAFFVLLRSDKASAANRGLLDVKLKQELRTANNVTLMIVPSRTYFLMSINEVELKVVSCQYRVDRGPILEKLLDVLDRAIVEYQIGPRPNANLRIGIIFEAKGDAVREFYFNDSEGHYNLVGFSGNHAIVALADLPNQLRALATSPGVVLTKDPRSRCPRP